MAKVKRATQEVVAKIRKPTPLEALAQETQETYAGNDSRVITRQRDVLRYELTATDDHLAGLRASLAAVQGKRARIEARIDGLTKVLNKR